MTRSIPFFTFFLLFTLAHLSLAEGDGVNPDYVFFSLGDTPQGWHWALADPDNWWVPLEANSGQSQSGKVTMEPVDFKGKGDAVQLTWNKKDKYGIVSLTGRTTDLSKYEHAAELVLIAKIDRKPKGDVKFSLDCGEGCNAQIPMKDLLRSSPQKEWFVLPIPLDCYTHAGAKLATVTTPVKIESQARFTISIAGAYIQPMAKGDEGCTPNPKAGASEAGQDDGK